MQREELRRRGKVVRTELGLAPRGTSEVVPGFDDLMAEVTFASIWDRPHLGRADRALCALAVLAPLQRLPQLEQMVATALDAGLPARGILEVFLQAGLYGGFVTAETAAHAAQGVFKARGIVIAADAPRNDTNEVLDKRGAELMAALHGERGSQGYAAPGNSITGQLYPAAIRYGYGELWFRPGLDHRQRMLVAIAAFTGLGLSNQLRKFAQSALNIGLRREEIIEAVIQTAPYGGFPRALEGLAILSEVL
jgi:4-carboxymuconolactone decarboxylase